MELEVEIGEAEIILSRFEVGGGVSTDGAETIEEFIACYGILKNTRKHIIVILYDSALLNEIEEDKISQKKLKPSLMTNGKIFCQCVEDKPCSFFEPSEESDIDPIIMANCMQNQTT